MNLILILQELILNSSGDESLAEINNIINTVKSGNRFEGKEFTNGNLNRTI